MGGKNLTVMLTVSSREFRSNQKNYLDMVAQGRELLLTRGKHEAFKVTKVSEDDTLVNKEEFYAQVEKAIAQAKAGETYPMLADESLSEFIQRINAVENV